MCLCGTGKRVRCLPDRSGRHPTLPCAISRYLYDGLGTTMSRLNPRSVTAHDAAHLDTFGQRGRRDVKRLVVVNVVAAAVFVAVPYSAAGDGALLVIMFAALASLVAGAARNPASRTAWILFAAATAAAVVTSTARATIDSTVQVEDDSVMDLLPEFLALPGYLLYLMGMAWILRRQRAGQADADRSDSALVGTAVGLIIWSLLIEPTISLGTVALLRRVITISFPFITALLMFTVARLLLSSERNRSLTLLSLGSVGLLLADVGYTLSDNEMANIPWSLPTLMYCASMTLGGAAALLPSARDITASAKAGESALFGTRRIAVGAALAAPALVVAVKPPDTVLQRSAFVLACAAMAVFVLRRVTNAVRGRVATEERLVHRSTHDHLTGLPNRSLLQREIDVALDKHADRENIVSVLFIDIDRFKQVNDTFGHNAGDELLTNIAERLASAVRPGDLLSRVSGDEFVVALAGGLDAALSVAQRLMGSFDMPFSLAVGNVKVSPSIGVASSSEECDADSILRDAEIAMYRAKHAGRNTVTVFNVQMRSDAAERAVIEASLRRAIDEGELRLFFQPITEITTGAVKAYEALVRWQHPERGLVPPDQFIPVAEETGIIVPLGEWVVRVAAEQLRAWRSAGRDISVSVNLSPRHLREPDVVQLIEGVLSEFDIAGENFWVEVTESLVLDEEGTAADNMAALRDLGVHLAIDDFGTGYASMSYVKRHSVDHLKIDKSFVSTLDESDADDAIVTATLAMAQALDIAVVAEGVETEEQLHRLHELGCQYAQGYLFSKPRPADEIDKECWPEYAQEPSGHP